MTEQNQITHMQVRIARMAAERWQLPIGEVGKLFRQFQVFEFIRDGFGIFHVEGDEAVWDELLPYLKSRGCIYA